jgi:hypothetical protein
MARDTTPVQTISRLTDLEVEYDMTLRVVSVLVERLQKLTGTREVQIPDAEVMDQPDLMAWRTAGEKSISLTTSR